ncbi:MAG: cobalamin-dependent protein, partial [bacterium]|nr:cobalamin-dependent protein [bacterium]
MVETVPQSSPGPLNPVRLVTAASLFDGHDASINIMRRILQAQGCEVIHLGHDRSVEQVLRAAIQEDVQGIAISSYQGGHVEYFAYLRELLDAAGAGHIRIYGGGGGVIVPDEIAFLAERRVRIFSPEDGQRMGLVGMIASMVAECDFPLVDDAPDLDSVMSGSDASLARAVTLLEQG